MRVPPALVYFFLKKKTILLIINQFIFQKAGRLGRISSGPLRRVVETFSIAAFCLSWWIADTTKIKDAMSIASFKDMSKLSFAMSCTKAVTALPSLSARKSLLTQILKKKKSHSSRLAFLFFLFFFSFLVLHEPLSPFLPPPYVARTQRDRMW